MEHRRVQIAEMVAQDQSSIRADQVSSTRSHLTSPAPCTACSPTPIQNLSNAEPTPPATEVSTLNLSTEVPASVVFGKPELTAVKIPSKKSLRSRKSSTILSRQSVVVVKSWAFSDTWCYYIDTNEWNAEPALPAPPLSPPRAVIIHSECNWTSLRIFLEL